MTPAPLRADRIAPASVLRPAGETRVRLLGLYDFAISEERTPDADPPPKRDNRSMERP